MIITFYCALCSKDGESVDHLFLRCEVAERIWKRIFYYMGILMEFGSSLLEMISCWDNVRLSTKRKILWTLCLAALCDGFGTNKMQGHSQTSVPVKIQWKALDGLHGGWLKCSLLEFQSMTFGDAVMLVFSSTLSMVFS